MKIAYVDPNNELGADFRGNVKDGQILLTGEEGAPDNYRLNFSRQTGPFFSPRHKHNFDQIRIVLGGGPMNYGPKQWIQPGEIAYFPEGTPYGPQDYDSKRYGMTLQFGGASGSGYISLPRMKEGMEALKAFGSFEKGIFTRSGDLPPGMKRNRDSYEAVWEYINDRPLDYPKPRYNEPILIKPKHFDWQPDAEQAGLGTKRLGSFSERQIEIAMLKIEAGSSARIAARAGAQIGIVVEGAGTIGKDDLRQHAAFSLEPGEGATISAATELALYLIGLPIFARQRIERPVQSAA
jgi:hypothetical protein